MMLPLLLDSALRSLVLGAAVWALLKLVRLRDTRTETAVWTAVLVAALSMPLLSRHIPGPVLTVPPLPAAAPKSLADLPLPGVQRLADAHVGDLSALAPAWLGSHGQTCLVGIYALGLIVCTLRLVTGLLLTWRLYRRAGPVDADWSQGRNIRVSVELKSPVSLGVAILVPADYREWSAAKRDAVLAHEEAHIARGDFFVQLAARIHCALFWFSPFAWWLQSKLAEIAETASDDAAVRRLEDRAAYAEILVEVSRCAQRTPLIMAMAKSSFIAQRVDHILSEAPDRHPGLALRAFTIAALTALAFAVAGAKTVVAPTSPSSNPLLRIASPTQGAAHSHEHLHAARDPQVAPPAAGSLPLPRNQAPGSTSMAAVGPSHPIGQVRPSPRDTDEVTYNPRALLDAPYSPRPNPVPASTIVHAGKSFYVRSTERPVADVGVTYGTDRQTGLSRNSRKTT